MTRYIIRRCFYSALIIVGVLLLTFLLFRVAAGDPARAVLGKNPSPKEVEEMRMSLSSGKPLFWGYWRKTEIFSSADFAERSGGRGVSVSGTTSRNDDGLRLDEGEISFKRNFDDPSAEIRVEITFKGEIAILFSDDSGKKIRKELHADSMETMAVEPRVSRETGSPSKVVVSSSEGAVVRSV